PDPALEGLPLKTPQQEGSKKSTDETPSLEPWLRQTLALKLKEVDGKIPDMDQGVFGKKMVLDQGLFKSKVLCRSALFNGLFLITLSQCITADATERWYNLQLRTPPLLNSGALAPLSERRVTVLMRNPHIPGENTFLSCYCQVIREPTHILDVNGFWTGK
ncbi:hypothetical protein PRIEUP_LOCUS401, partial [Pristimantis euphronides]